MNENIDLTKILKNCPKGWKFYSSIYGNVTFNRIENDTHYPIVFLSIDKRNMDRCGSVTRQGLSDFYCNGECTFFPSKDQQDWSKFTAPWYKKDKFDPTTLQPFDKVLVKDTYNDWSCELFSCIVDTNSEYKYKCLCSYCKYCIPYNDDTKHLMNTKDAPSEYYRYWED